MNGSGDAVDLPVNHAALKRLIVADPEHVSIFCVFGELCPLINPLLPQQGLSIQETFQKQVTMYEPPIFLETLVYDVKRNELSFVNRREQNCRYFLMTTLLHINTLLYELFYIYLKKLNCS